MEHEGNEFAVLGQIAQRFRFAVLVFEGEVRRLLADGDAGHLFRRFLGLAECAGRRGYGNCEGRGNAYRVCSHGLPLSVGCDRA